MVPSTFSLNELTIGDKVIPRPGSVTTHHIPDPRFELFWTKFYSLFYNEIQLSHPLGSDRNFVINPIFGYFGFRFHPITFQPSYFHVGLDFDQTTGHNVFAFTDGLFEYSGYGKENGHYVMISHPDIFTKDNFKLYSLYLHLDKYFFNFSLFEKSLREVGLRGLTEKKIKSGQIIATTGDSGNSVGVFPHLHFQLEFRSNQSQKIIVVDPAPILGYPVADNKTKAIKDFKEFKIFYEMHKVPLKNWSPLIKKYELDHQIPEP